AGLDARLLRLGGQRLADGGGLLGLRALEGALPEPARGRKCAACLVVDELGEDTPVRAEHDEARPLGRARHLAAHAPVTAETCLANGRAHALFPTFLRTCSPW